MGASANRWCGIRASREAQGLSSTVEYEGSADLFPARMDIRLSVPQVPGDRGGDQPPAQLAFSANIK